MLQLFKKTTTTTKIESNYFRHKEQNRNSYVEKILYLILKLFLKLLPITIKKQRNIKMLTFFFDDCWLNFLNTQTETFMAF